MKINAKALRLSAEEERRNREALGATILPVVGDVFGCVGRKLLEVVKG
jgi:hypothetical protein